MKNFKVFLSGIIFFAAMTSMTSLVNAQSHVHDKNIIQLYPTDRVQSLGVPEREEILQNGEILIYDVSEPTIEVFKPAPNKSNGTAVIVVPGGGFVAISYKFGGTEIAKELNKHGITAFVLKHRTIKSGNGPMHIPQIHMKEMELIMSRAKTGLPIEVPPLAGEPNAIEDGVRTLEIIRHRAHEFGIDPHRVGILGFSSGAYLAADLAIGAKEARPDFVGLIYGGLRTPIPHDAPPAFIAGAGNDEYQPNDPLLLYTAWRKANVPAELHLYERGGHGFDLRKTGNTSDHWFQDFIWWLQSRKLLD